MPESTARSAQQWLSGIFLFWGKGAQTHAENTSHYASGPAYGVAGPAASESLRHSGGVNRVNCRKEALEKLTAAVLAAAVALLCAAIDHFIEAHD